MNKLIIALFILVAGISNTVAQGNSISGRVLNNNNEPLVGVNILIKEKNIGAETVFDGNFEIKTSKGKFTLIVSYIGFKTREILVNAPANLSNIILYEGNELLQEVLLTSRNNKFSRKKTAYVSKLPLKDIENSQVYTTVTSEMLESQIITSLDDALTNATGISKLWESTGRAPGRGTGFFASRGFATQPQFVDGVPGITLSAVDPSYVERIEVIKGPSATLFGSTYTSLGGLINLVTKKPYEGFGGSITYTGGSFNVNRVSLDINTPIGNSNNTFLRINTSILDQGSFQNTGFKKTFFVAPSLSFRANNKLSFSLGIEYSKTKQTNSSMLFLRRGMPLVSKNIKELNIDPKKSFTSNDLHLTNPVFTTRAIIDYKVSDQWSSKTVFASSYAETNGYYQYNIEGASAAFLPLKGLLTNPKLASLNPILTPIINPMLEESISLLNKTVFTRVIEKRDGNITNFNLQQNFTGDFKVGKLRNRMIFGLDYVNKSRHLRNKSGNPLITKSSNFPQLLSFLKTPPAYIPTAFKPALLGLGLNLEGKYSGLPYFDAFFDAQGNIISNTLTPNAKKLPTKKDLDNIFSQLPVIDRKSKSQVLATYLSNILNVTKNLTVNVGLRLDHFIQDGNLATDKDNYSQTNFSPSAGILYQPIKNKLSIFTNYQTGFINTNPTIKSNGDIQTFDPQKAKQFEGGVKTNLLNSKLNFGLSYYHISVNDRPTNDPRVLLISTRIPVEEIINKGVEFEMNTNPLLGLNVRASYAYNDSKITKTTLPELQNRRPEEAGPASIYNFWADYKFQEGGSLKNLGIGAGFNGASKHDTVDNSISGQFELPNYTIFNTAVYYKIKKIKFGLKVNNITDKTYYKGWGTVNAQPSRAFLGTVSYKF
ncbi:TonB-dependent receptor [Tenacibaculum finnmarkense]|uniref:TonB-dependent receptor n=1 Tax=Tenacibaculum finnmarkense TaxID=2781243 RepID=UPI00187B3D01|nr:TonB-dependent receptor [Tenacibaculum finnmarkense]MBE7659400.1 TonB-dependent receptor [Tenacibaculum finnmarkense genomovar finnmarkense]MCG8251037.1 TonB-dependent receptor [Tenacibaculum finnmarkense genomovar finnmarkense]MCG8814702.1 TonB-dependent receptor [Tenacibaculum finnmarkense]MCG8819856.1 TonB-dependent receptor [Tenacibaculum finnmarkense]MCG8894318.1 TonB-dependent receptor [Tenacibaculum finnmarkense]